MRIMFNFIVFFILGNNFLFFVKEFIFPANSSNYLIYDFRLIIKFGCRNSFCSKFILVFE